MILDIPRTVSSQDVYQHMAKWLTLFLLTSGYTATSCLFKRENCFSLNGGASSWIGHHIWTTFFEANKQNRFESNWIGWNLVILVHQLIGWEREFLDLFWTSEVDCGKQRISEVSTKNENKHGIIYLLSTFFTFEQPQEWLWILLKKSESLGIQSPSENGFMEPKYLGFRRWLYTPIIIWQGDWISRE